MSEMEAGKVLELDLARDPLVAPGVAPRDIAYLLLRWQGRPVGRLVIEPALGAWVFHRLDVDGGFVGDSWHDSREDALWQAKREFDVDVSDASPGGKTGLTR